MNDDYWDLVGRLVPDHGVADTVQGEVVRAVLRLTAECAREGCANWDNYLEALLEFARDRFSDGTVEAELAERASAILERIADFGRSVGDPETGALNQPAEPSLSPADEEEVIRQLCLDMNDPLEEAAVQWCHRHPVPIPFQPDPDYGAST